MIDNPDYDPKEMLKLQFNAGKSVFLEETQGGVVEGGYGVVQSAERYYKENDAESMHYGMDKALYQFIKEAVSYRKQR